MKQYFVKCGIAMALSVLFMAPSIAGADVFMKEKHQTDGMTVMGHAQPPRDTIQTTWVTQDKLRNDQGDTSSIVIMVNDNILPPLLGALSTAWPERGLPVWIRTFPGNSRAIWSAAEARRSCHWP